MAEYNADTSDGTETRKANDIVFNQPNRRGLGTFFWERTESGAWGPGLFTLNSNTFTADAAAFTQYEAMRAPYGL